MSKAVVVTESGVVLRRLHLSDSKDIIVLFTPRGRLDCLVYQSARRGGLLEPLTCIKAYLKTRARSDLLVLEDLEFEGAFSGLLGDLERLEAAGYLAALWLEAFPGLTETNDPYRLLRIGLEALEAGLERELLLSWIEVQVLRLLGNALRLDRCAHCGTAPPNLEDAGEAWFSAQAGGLVCSNCRFLEARPFPPELQQWLGFVQRARLVKLGAAQPSMELVHQGRSLLEEVILGYFPRLEKFR